MANKSNSRAASARPGKGNSSAPRVASSSVKGSKSAPKRTLTAVVGGKAREELAVIKRTARGALRDVSSGVQQFGDHTLELGSSAVKGASDVGRNVGVFASDHRYALALGALSIGLLATARQLMAVGAASAAAASANGAAKAPRSKLSQSAHALTDGAQATTQEVIERAEAGYARVEGAAQNVFHAHPLLVGGAVLSAGLAIGFALPASDREKELLEDIGKGLASTGKHSLDELISRAEHTVQAATNVTKLVSAALGR